MSLLQVELEDKYQKVDGRIYLTGIQALVRLPLLQRQLDLAAGHNTAGYISGYRGSPLGNFDQQLASARRFLDAHHVKAQPGVNEDMAATALWGTQQINLFGDGAYDGVFGMWYGKGPGVDRTGDVFRHANLAGTAPLGGVLVLMGDDHTCESSTTAHQSEYGLVDAMIPILNPAGVGEILQFGLIGFALSRFSGCWVGVKCVHDTVNTAASIEARVAPDITLPDRSVLPPDGLNIRWPDTPQAQEARLHLLKHDAVKAFVLANQLDRLVFPTPRAKLGVISTGKSYLDLMQALDDLGIDEAMAKKLGLRVLKLGLTYPIASETIRAFAKGLKQIVVVEEKRGLIETQVKELLFGQRSTPSVVGKKDEEGNWLFPSNGALSSNLIAEAIGTRLLDLGKSNDLQAALAALEVRKKAEAAIDSPVLRTPYFCSGCPHNTSTRVPEGSVARAGIGCHYMAQWMDRDNQGYTQMGGEGASWIGEAPFSKRRHIFQNIGDGTYYHSGLMAIRAAIASGVNITFKILYNDAVAMTGGQAVDGQLSVPGISRQVTAEGAVQVVVVTDEPEKYPLSAGFAPGVTIRHRDELDQVQRELREVEGTSVLIYDQTCAAEKRRRRKRGHMIDPPKRVVINEAVCEGCGDCGEVSNCVSILPLETEFGRKRQIDQSSCNKDFSCLKGFCPSFVTVEGASLARREGRDIEPLSPNASTLPDPEIPVVDGGFGIVVAGVGGTGVVTIGALLGMAAHLEGKGAAVLDMTGLAQKGGPVTSHLRIAASPDDIQTTRIASGGARLLLGCDLMVAGGKSALQTLDPDRGHVVVNDNFSITGEFTRNADLAMPGNDLRSAIQRAAGDRAAFVEANRLATALLGDAIGTNLFMVGYAYQNGLLPVSAKAIERAIELNRVAIDMNRKAFRLGRLAAHDPDAIEAMAAPLAAIAERQPATGLEEMVERRVAYLTAYQDQAYAERYRELVMRVQRAEAKQAPGMHGLAEAVARYYFKLLAYKDEYEVARLYSDGAFEKKIARQFEGGGKITVHLAPPLFAERDPITGHLQKKAYGPWIFTAFKWLAKLKHLRGTAFDPFGYTAERRTERRLITHYEALLVEILTLLDHDNQALAIEIASLPEQIRGFGHVKERHLAEVRAREAALLDAFRQPATTLSAAE
ncbi:MAG: indolepyruvate ferredoxin oxidoreductase family protein [Alphaproteobacteria bacterium]|nr:indolepyruvate ferredoxin oxidoreductase family protein [Alphaproteobacteria bacterium]